MLSKKKLQKKPSCRQVLGRCKSFIGINTFLMNQEVSLKELHLSQLDLHQFFPPMLPFHNIQHYCAFSNLNNFCSLTVSNNSIHRLCLALAFTVIQSCILFNIIYNCVKFYRDISLSLVALSSLHKLFEKINL